MPLPVACAGPWGRAPPVAVAADQRRRAAEARAIGVSQRCRKDTRHLHRKNPWVSGNRYADLAEYLISKGAVDCGAFVSDVEQKEYGIPGPATLLVRR